MHINRLVLSVAVIFILSSLFGSIIHALLLHSDYAAFPQVFRAPVDANVRLILFSHLSFAVACVWIYSHGVEDLPWVGQGVRFGIAMWLATSLPWFVLMYATQPLGETLLWKQLAYEFVAKVLLGIATAALVRRR